MANTDYAPVEGVLNDVWDQASHTLRLGPASGALKVSKAVTFTGAANLGAVGTVSLFTVSGQVLVNVIAVCGTTLVGATATHKVGNTTTVTRYDASLTATTMTAGDTLDLSGRVTAGTAPAITPTQVAFDTEVIIATIATAAITAGQLTYYAFYTPLTAGATVVAN
jgi:hypothetical protein